MHRSPLHVSPCSSPLPTSHRLYARLPQMYLWFAPALWWQAGPPLGEMSSNSTSGRTSRGSGFHSPSLSSVPRSVCYNLISVSSVTCSGRKHKCHSSKHDDFSDDDDDFAPASAPTASNEA